MPPETVSNRQQEYENERKVIFADFDRDSIAAQACAAGSWPLFARLSVRVWGSAGERIAAELATNDFRHGS